MRGYGGTAIDPAAASSDWEKRIAVPAEVLASTFGLIRTSQTVVRANSITYVFERKRDVFGREVCRAFRVTEHPKPTPPPRIDASKPVFPDRDPDLEPITEYVDVSCNDPAMQHVPPGSLASPHPTAPPAHEGAPAAEPPKLHERANRRMISLGKRNEAWAWARASLLLRA
jgi:hypothetical protein